MWPGQCDENTKALKDDIEKVKECVEKTVARSQHLEQELQKKEPMIAHFKASNAK
jgi:hypothetical protein